MMRPNFHENRNLVPLSVHDMLWICIAMICGIAACAIFGTVALRADRPAACDPYPTYADCAAAIAEGR